PDGPGRGVVVPGSTSECRPPCARPHGLASRDAPMSDHQDIARFTSVDHTADPEFFVRFMAEGHRIPAIQAIKQLIREQLRLRPGDAVLDVGCGAGISLLEMADVVGPSGRLVGLDASETMIAAARQRAVATGAPASFEVGDAQALPFAEATFDGCYVERMLM